MTFKAVQFNTDSTMTAGAEMFAAVIEDANDFTVLIRSGVAVDALNQAMLFGTNTVMHGRITLVQQIFHMVGTNIGSRLNALFTLGCWYDIAIIITVRAAITAARKAGYRPQ